MGRRLRQRGQSLVEFALIVPILLAVLFIIIELGIVFSIYVGLTNSAREVARAGSVYQFPNPRSLANPTDPNQPRNTVDAARLTYMQQIRDATLNPMVDAGQLTMTVNYPDPPTNDFRYGDKVNVTLTYTHQLFFNMIGTTLTLQATSAMRIEPGGM